MLQLATVEITLPRQISPFMLPREGFLKGCFFTVEELRPPKYEDKFAGTEF